MVRAHLCQLLLLLLAHNALTLPLAPSTFGRGVPNFPVTSSEEREMFSHLISPGATRAAITHFWSTACGGNTPPWAGANSGSTIYRFYIDNETVPSVELQPRMATGFGFFGDMSVAGETEDDPWAGPWGTEWIGKTSDMDGFYLNIRIPFYRSIRVTAILPPGVPDFEVYSIFRGAENIPVLVGGVELPLNATLILQKRTRIQYNSLDLITIAELSQGSGAVFAHTLAIEGNPGFTYLEGCFHLLTPHSAMFPGIVLSTGMEDYYDSSFYFHSGPFQTVVAGVTHMCSPKPSPPHPNCSTTALQNQSQFSAYRFHDVDPLFFHHGVKLMTRNGDVAGPISGGPPGYTGKCYNQDRPAGGGPGVSVVSSYAWIYKW